MNISQVAKLTHLSAKSIRFYEQKGVVSEPQRAENGYRSYAAKQIEQLKLVARARAVGFSLEQCKELVHLADDPQRTSFEVKQKAQQKLQEVEQKLLELQTMRQQLVDWIAECPGNDGAHCPIIDDLTGKCQR